MSIYMFGISTNSAAHVSPFLPKSHLKWSNSRIVADVTPPRYQLIGEKSYERHIRLLNCLTRLHDKNNDDLGPLVGCWPKRSEQPVPTKVLKRTVELVTLKSKTLLGLNATMSLRLHTFFDSQRDFMKNPRFIGFDV